MAKSMCEVLQENRKFHSVYPLDAKDFNSGRCRLGELSIKKAGVAIKEAVCITIKELELKIFCTVWPVTYFTPPEDFLQVDISVVLATGGNNHDIKSINRCRVKLENDLKVVKPCQAKDITVTVYVRNESQKVPPRLLYDYKRRKAQVRCVLQDKVFTQNCWVCVKQLRHCGVAFIEEINKIFIDNVEGYTNANDETSYSDNTYIIGQKTNILVNAIKRSTKTTQVPFCLAGYGIVAKLINETIALPLTYPKSCNRLNLEHTKGFLLVGPPGVGKTSLVTYIAEQWGAEVFLINGCDVFRPHMGESESNLRDIFDTASEASKYVPCILFIDEIDALCPKRSQGSDVETRVASQLLTLIDETTAKTSIILIAATNRPNVLDPALRRPGRFDKEFIIGVPSSSERLEILKCLTCKLLLSPDVKLDHLAEQCLGYVAADLAALVRQATMNSLRLTFSADKTFRHIAMNDFKLAFKEIVPSTYRGMDGLVESCPVHWQDIGGYEHVKQVLRQAVEWPFLYPDAFVRLGISRPRGILLYGPPGCSKTTLVRAAATSCHCTFLSLSCAQLYSPYVGDAEKLIREVFTKARAAAPTILFLDEVDAVVRKRSIDDGNVEARILSTLLNEMDGVGVSSNVYETQCANREQSKDQNSLNYNLEKNILFVAATNRPDVLDEAILRPGRVDRIIYVPHPDKETRLEILKIYCRKIPLDDNVDLNMIAEQTDIFSGADLKNLCREAALNALQELGVESCCRVDQKHFSQALNGISPSLTQAQVNAYENVLFS